MNRFATKMILIAIGAAFVLSTACGGGDPVDKMAGHMDAIVKILEANKDNPDKAGEALEKYLKDNEQALKDLQAEANKIDMGKDEAKKKELEEKMKAKMEGIKTRMTALMKDAPDLMKNEKVQKAMMSMPFK